MKAPGDAAMELAWLPPSAGRWRHSPARNPPPVWRRSGPIRGACCSWRASRVETSTSWAATLGSLSLLETSLQFLQNAGVPFVDWAQPAPARLSRLRQRQAWLASELAARVTGCDPERAWISGLLAPLGWLALAALDSEKAAQALRRTGLPYRAAALAARRLEHGPHRLCPPPRPALAVAGLARADRRTSRSARSHRAAPRRRATPVSSRPTGDRPDSAARSRTGPCRRAPRRRNWPTPLGSRMPS